MVAAPVQLSPLELAKFKLCEPVPRAMVALVLSRNVPAVSLNPAVAPVLKVPPSSITFEASGIALAAPSITIPWVIVVVPEKLLPLVNTNVPVPI